MKYRFSVTLNCLIISSITTVYWNLNIVLNVNVYYVHMFNFNFNLIENESKKVISTVTEPIKIRNNLFAYTREQY